MNNIIYHNIIRKMGKKIEEEKKETEGVVKNGYPCTKDCYLKRTDKCKNRTEQCSWDLRSNFWKGADTLGKRKY